MPGHSDVRRFAVKVMISPRLVSEERLAENRRVLTKLISTFSHVQTVTIEDLPARRFVLLVELDRGAPAVTGVGIDTLTAVTGLAVHTLSGITWLDEVVEVDPSAATAGCGVERGGST